MDAATVDFVLKLMALFGGVVAVAIICATVLGVAAFKRTQHGAARTFSELFRRAGLLQLLTVLVIVVSVLVLAILGKTDEGALTVLSGIAGYVLGGLPRSTANARREEITKEDP